MSDTASEDLNGRVRTLIEGVIGELVALGMERENACLLLGIQAACRMSEDGQEELRTFLDPDDLEPVPEPPPFLRLVS